MAKIRILVADDHALVREGIIAILRLHGDLEVATEAADGKEALSAVADQEPDVLVLDHKMPAPDGMEVLRRLRGKGFTFPIIMLTAHGNVQTAVEAMKAGADEYLTKPFDLEELKLSIEKALKMSELAAEVDRLRGELEHELDLDGIVAADPKMLGVLETVRKVAPTNASVMLYGESGTGKELVARALHQLSERALRPFVSVSAGALPETLLESELFGYMKGSFTGAYADKAGLFEVAHKGTIFLDEIGELSPFLQVKILRAVQDKTFRRVGGARDISVDVRIISATNRNLEERVKSGDFREDLFYRLNVIPVEVPPLRERKEDILCRHLLDKIGRKFGRSAPELSAPALALLLRHQWPGNVRELENTLERAVVLADRVILPEHLPPQLAGAEGESGLEALLGTFSLKKGQREMERVLIGRALEASGGNKSKASRLLEISYPSLLAKIKEYGL